MYRLQGKSQGDGAVTNFGVLSASEVPSLRLAELPRALSPGLGLSSQGFWIQSLDPC